MKVNIGKFPKNPTKDRKVKIKIHDHDTWNADHTMALVILPLLKRFKKTVHGYPMDFDNSDPYATPQLSFEGDDWTHHTDQGIKRWKKTIGKMIWSFEQVLDSNWEKQYNTGVSDYKFKKIKSKKGNTIGGKMIHGKKHTLKIDIEGINQHQKRIQEGLDLFGKYFQSLWY